MFLEVLLQDKANFHGLTIFKCRLLEDFSVKLIKKSKQKPISVLAMDAEDDRVLIMNCLNEAHDKELVCLSEPEIRNNTKLSKLRVRVALELLQQEGKVKIEKHGRIRIAYLTDRVHIS